MTKDVTLTAEWKVESANGSSSIDTITDQDSSNSAINGENPGQGDLPETDNGNKGPDAPDYVVLPNEGESNSQVNDGNSSSNSQVTNTTPPQNQGGTATSPGNSGTTLPNSSGSSVSSSNNSNSSSAKDLTASPNAPPVNAPKNSSILRCLGVKQGKPCRSGNSNGESLLCDPEKCLLVMGSRLRYLNHR